MVVTDETMERAGRGPELRSRRRGLLLRVLPPALYVGRASALI